MSRSVELSQCAAEQRRLTSREKTRKGRELNLAGANAGAAVPRQAAGVFDAAEREAAVENETAALAAVIGDPGTNSAGRVKASDL